jgi:hypothetical protein
LASALLLAFSQRKNASFWVLLQFEPSLSSRNSFSESIANKFIVLLSWNVGIWAADHLSELLVIFCSNADSLDRAR